MITCAIQIGSSRILAIAANKDMRDGRLSNIQIESEPAHDCVSHGCITNVEKTAMHLRSLIQKLSNRMRTTLSSAYVGIGGISLHSLIQLPSVQLPDYDVLASETISGNRYQLTIGQKYLRQGVTAAMERANIKIADVIALPQATACILTEEERRQGCVLIDMGADTTTVSIYKDDDLHHLAVIPLGGEAVTLDIQSAGCSHDEAERIKVEWSNVAHEVTGDAANNAATLSQFADKTLPFPQSKLNNIALCRYEEIAANIQHQIELCGMKDQLSSCIITGGAAMQNGLTTLLTRCLSVSRIETRAFSERALLGSERKPHLTNTLALLTFCADDCQAPAQPVTAVPRATSSTQTTSATSVPSNDGQITLDIPDSEPDDTDTSLDTGNIRKSIGRFVKDLFTGQ